MLKEKIQKRIGLLASAVAAKNNREVLTHEGNHPHSFWIYHAMVIGWSMDILGENQPYLRQLAVEWWDRAAREGKLLDC